MIQKPIYEPKTRAREYGDLALNIYSGCNHGCTYCYAPQTSRKSREAFLTVSLRRDIVESVKRQLERERITGKLIHLCFLCDPYPADTDTTPTREIIKLIKASGNNVQILTKGGLLAERDFDLLDCGDWFGVTYTGGLNGVGVKNDYEPNAAPDAERFLSLHTAYKAGIKTWLSCEPIINPGGIYQALKYVDYADLWRIGKLNHQLSGIDWARFGAECAELGKRHGRNIYIKNDLRYEMALGDTLNNSMLCASKGVLCAECKDCIKNLEGGGGNNAVSGI